MGSGANPRHEDTAIRKAVPDPLEGVFKCPLLLGTTKNIDAPLLMAEFEKRKSAQNKESAQEEVKVQKEGQKRDGRTIHSWAIYLDKDNMYNRIPPTPACSISPDWDIISSPLSLMSSNSWAVYYGDAAAIYGQAQRCIARQEEEEIAPEDSTSMRVSPTHEIINSLEVLALVQ